MFSFDNVGYGSKVSVSMYDFPIGEHCEVYHGEIEEVTDDYDAVEIYCAPNCNKLYFFFSQTNEIKTRS